MYRSLHAIDRGYSETFDVQSQRGEHLVFQPLLSGDAFESAAENIMPFLVWPNKSSEMERFPVRETGNRLNVIF